MQDVWSNRSLEDEVLFQRYHIVGYATDDGGVCDRASGSGGDEHPGADDNQGLDSGAS